MADRVKYAGASFSMTCPLDGLAMKSTQPDLVGDLSRDAKVGGHVHVEFSELAECSNGHRWRLTGDLLLERTP